MPKSLKSAKKSLSKVKKEEIIQLAEPKSMFSKTQRKFIGAHVSVVGGLHKAFENARQINASSMAIFLKNQKRWNSPPLPTAKEVEMFKNASLETNIPLNLVLSHGSYLINLGNPDSDKRAKSYDSFIDDLRRCHLLGLPLYNIHPGSTVGGCSSQESIAYIADAINTAITTVPEVCVVLETMAGQGNQIGSTFEELRDIINLVHCKDRVGVCIDTCHIFSAGYDISNVDGYNSTMQSFGDIVGWKYLKGVHLNDSMTPYFSRKDRHENIGRGSIGKNGFQFIMNDSRFDNIPIVLETPADDLNQYKAEIELLYSL